MKTYLLLVVLIMVTVTSCHESAVAPQEDLSLLNNKFHGKYKIVTSTSNIAVDINRDGKASTDLMQEIDYLTEAELDIRIYPKNNNSNSKHFLFSQLWQQQFISPNTTDTVINYALQGVVRSFEFSQNLDRILVSPDENQVDLKLFPLPDTVTIVAKEQIEVVMQKLIYTTNGWKSLTITTLYKRYTKTT
ncbi:hypothetical protein [Adhaeribacter pallidiroseus]|uniref:Lipid/polyisoprenoid-binding YceI-like domain-containing protein n=1 Tax=Adhaeribacter pallidiroseus TaxID=2072847 RepID=A0A369QKC4_9BACT|nr:hypothetical protein [Adhaeribacter pallidiroseus]RDC65184.1 hypothetical protein AHMF7616_03814 [Adhaeribacter pallidiroseus]